MDTNDDLIRMSAVAVRDLLLKEEVTPLDLLDALEARIAEVDGAVNALPTLCFDRARDHARRLMDKPVEERGMLAGMPVPIKDLVDVGGVLNTKGSPIFAEHVPEVSDIMVERLEAEGGVVYAKSNTPEFGAGANTFNEVFGRTLNPWNTSRSAAGSSGGAAVSLATGTAWLAHGSDLGGSLRNPASFCGIVGMRPSPGRVPATPTPPIDQTLGVEGPMARNVEDLALMFDALTGEDPRDPISLHHGGQSFLDAARSGWKPLRVAFSRDLGITPVDSEVADICERAAMRFAEAGVEVVEAHPDFTGVHECFDVLRAATYVAAHKRLYEEHKDKLKPEVVWNIEAGLKLTAGEIAHAQHLRAELFARARAFFGDYDLLLTPATIVSAFPVEQRYLEELNGHRFSNYVEWLAIAYAMTMIASPAISIPAGFTSENLPVGLQIAAPTRGEARLLAGAKVLESILWQEPIVPIDPRPGN
ncbi:amidase [Microbaculum marinum]|uniref:Amidase family protein n=1 Tax=Microbaculum marinum TaxID=1764581 RepID=A0AAW9RRR2_9HYPH